MFSKVWSCVFYRCNISVPYTQQTIPFIDIPSSELFYMLAAMLKRPRTPSGNPATEYQSADSEHVLKRSRPIGISDEVICSDFALIYTLKVYISWSFSFLWHGFSAVHFKESKILSFWMTILFSYFNWVRFFISPYRSVFQSTLCQLDTLARAFLQTCILLMTCPGMWPWPCPRVHQ